MANWDEIKKQVENNGNVHTFRMEDLRNAHGAGKLGVTVRSEIKKCLAGMGLGHVPQDLPNYQNEPVRHFKRGTPIGDLIDIILAPGEQNDKKLKEQINQMDNNYAPIIQQIRDLVEE